jgi:histidinol-phosphatase (PHP family)
MSTQGLVDYHVHTVRCGHAVGRMEDYANSALRLGLSEIGYSDHFPLLHTEDPTLSMNLDELPAYVREVEEMRERFSGLEIRLGIEVDYVPQTLERLRQLLDNFPFDYVMGSLHFIDGWGFDDPRFKDGYLSRDLFALWARYFDLLGQAAESGLFDVLAHPDLIKKFGYRPEEDITDLYRECLDRVARAGLAVEVSTAGLRKPVGEIYPAEDFLRLCRDRDIPVTLGSDAHDPSEVGKDFDKALDLLRRVGYGELALFKGGNRTSLELPLGS